MKKRSILLLLSSFFVLGGCPAPSSPTSVPSASSYDSYYGGASSYASAYPSAAPSAVASAMSATDLSSLRAGVIPETSYTDEERKLAGFLVRKTKPVFPLKVGVLLYRDSGALSEGDRRNYYEAFLTAIKSNPNIGQIVELSPELISKNPSIDEIRALGSRFQVASVMVINDSYPFPIENSEAIITPIDSITGTRTWQTFSNIEVYAIDILNGVFLFSSSSGLNEIQKYNRTSSTVKNPDSALIKSTAQKVWKNLEEKINKEINDYKNRLDNNTSIPITVKTPVPLPTPTPVPTPTPTPTPIQSSPVTVNVNINK